MYCVAIATVNQLITAHIAIDVTYKITAAAIIDSSRRLCIPSPFITVTPATPEVPV